MSRRRASWTGWNYDPVMIGNSWGRASRERGNANGLVGFNGVMRPSNGVGRCDRANQSILSWNGTGGKFRIVWDGQGVGTAVGWMPSCGVGEGGWEGCN